MVTLSGYEIGDCMVDGVQATLWRGARHSDGRSVIIKVQTQERPGIKENAMFRHERDMLTRLRALPVLPLVGMEMHGRRAALVFDDPGGEFLSQRLAQRQQPLTPREALALARQISIALEQIHSGGVVHKKLSPQAIFICDDGQVHLHEFGVATALTKEERWDSPTALITETLPYISPEQTGRMNRVVDYRSDYYALGVLLFEMCTLSLPFEAEDAMGWVHCHIAKAPPKAHERQPGLSPVISALIDRLMAKTAEQRYQSSRGLVADLERCIEALDKGTLDAEMVLGRVDLSGRFELAQTLFGRQRELELMDTLYERVHEHPVAVWLRISGAAGVGKSALIMEHKRALVQRPGLLIQGKFEQYQRNVPYASMIQAFRGLIQRLLMESQDEIEQWRMKIMEALGVNVSVVLDVLPELELIVGEQPAMTALGVAERQNRFELTFQRFVGLFCQPSHPLILVLDDVQWADSASVALLSALLTDPQAKHLLIITASRDDEIERVQGWHELELQAQSASSLEAHRIDLGNLSEAELAMLVSQTLGQGVNEVSDLVSVLRQKTEGNPFFIKELFTSLWEQGHIRFDIQQERWSWQIEAIQKAQMTDNVIALLSDKILRLDPQAQRVLQVAACIGGQFELETLARVCKQPEPQTAAWLWEAMQEGLLSALDDNYKYLLLEDLNDGEGAEPEAGIRGVTYRFQHDRVQQAAYSMLSAEEAAKLHLAIGRRMIESGSSSTYDRHEQLFDVVSQLNQAISLMDDGAERLGLAQLNLTAARRAKSSLAYDFARQCASAGLACLADLGEQAWQTQHELMFELSLICAQCDYLLGDFEQAQRRFELLRERCRAELDRARITIDQVELLGHRNQHHEAVRLGLEGLAMLGLSLPAEPKTPSIIKEVAAVRWARRGTDSVKLMHQHEVSDERIRLAKTMILTMAASANFTSTTLFPLLVLKMTAMAIKHGHTDGSSFAYAGYGLILTAVLGDVVTGRAFGELSLGLSERYVGQNPSAKVRNLFIFGGIINHWSAPARANVPFLRQCISLGLECGDLVYAGYAVTILVDSLFYAGADLKELAQECASQLETLSRVRDEDSMNMARATYQAVLALMGQTDSPLSLSTPSYDEAKHAEQMRQSINQNPNAIYQTARVKLMVLHGDYEQAAAVAAASSSYPEGTLGLLVVPEHMTYEAIALCKRYEAASARERLAITRKVQAHLGKLKKWAKHSPDNFAHKIKIIEALWSQIKRDELDAPARFDEAIALAEAASATHDEGLFAILAAEYYQQIGRGQVALAYAKAGLKAYSRWGASALVGSLLERFSGLKDTLEPSALRSGQSVSSLDSAELIHVPEVESALDLATVLKATQALSSELQLEPLLRRLLSIVLENAGAQRGAVLLYDEASLCVFALAQADQGQLQTMLDEPQPLATRQDLAIKIVTYVERTQESVVLEDASLVGAFTNDPYVAAHRPRSLLCMPVVHKGSMIGALYLENNLTTGAFTQDRLEVLSVVCTQLAISIEHARMYQEVERARAGLEARVNERTQELEQANHELQFEIAERKRAQAQAVEASQSKSLFLANMSHELRTPLNAIIGYSELVREDMEDMEHDEHVEDIDRILVSAHHLLNLINDILDLSKIEARKMDVLLGDVDIESLVTEVATTARPLIERNHNNFNIQTDPVFIRTDKTKLTQVLVNLLSNASKFTEHGTVSLEVKTHMLDGRAWVHLSVSDTGIGMSQEQLSRLFQVFSQAESDTQSKYGGTGLGLALSRQLCRLLGGDIHVTSVQGEGSIFTVVLPQFPDEESLADEASVTFEDS